MEVRILPSPLMSSGFEDLREALDIFGKYSDARCPTHCEHDVMYITSEVTEDDMMAGEVKRLDDLGFHVDDDGTFYSFRFGSC